MDQTAAGPPVAAQFPDGRPRWRRVLPPAGTLAGSAAGFAYVGMVDPNRPGHYPVCPLLQLTGIYCPACGGLRTAHALAHADLGAALGFNGLATVALIGFVLFLPLWGYRAARGWRTYPPLSGAHWGLIGAVVIVFTLVRNLPFGSALAP